MGILIFVVFWDALCAIDCTKKSLCNYNVGKQLMKINLVTIYSYISVFYVIVAALWRYIEILTLGHPNENMRDSIIWLGLLIGSCILATVIYKKLYTRTLNRTLQKII